jgi:hypothetical protein
MLGSEFIIIAILLRFWAGANYLIATWRGSIKPSPITWLFWGLAPLVAFAAQIQTSIEPTAWVSLALGLGPLLIFAVSIGRGSRWRIGPFDILCGMSALVGIVLWQITTDASLALAFGIIADLLGGIPTLRKSYQAPSSEKAFPYFLSILSMVVTLLTLKNWSFLNYGFPLYILLINLVLFVLIASKIGRRTQTEKRHRAAAPRVRKPRSVEGSA